MTQCLVEGSDDRPFLTRLYLADKNGAQTSGVTPTLVVTSVNQGQSANASSEVLSALNPTSASALITISLPHYASNVSLNICTVEGKLIHTFSTRDYEAGNNVVRWSSLDANGVPVPSGWYLVQGAGGEWSVSSSVLVRR